MQVAIASKRGLVLELPQVERGLVGIHVDRLMKSRVGSLHLLGLSLITLQINSYLLKRRQVLHAQLEITRLMHSIPRLEMQLESLELLHRSWCENHLHDPAVSELC